MMSDGRNHLRQDKRRNAPRKPRWLGGWGVAVLVSLSLLLAPLHGALAATPVSADVVTLHGFHGADHPCPQGHGAGTEKAPVGCCAAAGGCILALSPVDDSVALPARAGAAEPLAVDAFAGRIYTPTPPPPRTLDA